MKQIVPDELTVERKVVTRIPTKEGEFNVFLYHSSRDPAKEHLAFVFGDISDGEVLFLLFLLILFLQFILSFYLFIFFFFWLLESFSSRS